MIKCPHCGRAAMRLGEKASLGPGRVVRFRSCGGSVAAHPIAILAAMALIHTFAVPLVKS